MPISKIQTIGPKLFVGLILAPFYTSVLVILTELIILVIASIYLMIHPILHWTLLWNFPVILLSWLRIFAAMLFPAL